MKKRSRILSILLAEVIALTCLWPGSTVMAQQVAGMRCKDYFRARECLEYLLLSSDPEQTRDKLRPTSSVTPR